ncbi:hypothetical protein SO802_024430 [Lithocarpus litseifolius]|uniref:DUF4216 domain-containing protein n=1 Tax=Lithocarpus litseifolius TaxID=425828 RepID=A0AAW2CBM7_9ROSI
MCPPPDGPPQEMVDSTPISSEQGALTASVTVANKWKRGRNLCTKFKKLRENGLKNSSYRLVIQVSDLGNVIGLPLQTVLRNRVYHHIDAVETHLILNRFDLDYTDWIFHGEEDSFFKHVQTEHNDHNSQAEDIDEVGEMLDDIYRGTFPDANIGESSTSLGPSNNDYKTRLFDQLWEDAQLRPLGAAKYVRLDDTCLTRARWYVLSNCSEIDSYKTEHYLKIQGEGIIDIDHKHEVEFENWFQNRICGSDATNVSQELYSLACGSDALVADYKGCIVNGVRFHTKDREHTRRTQNSGVFVLGEYGVTKSDYYGELRNVLELNYLGNNHVYLFECDWWDTRDGTRMQRDKHFTSVNTSRTWYHSDPFILACQASQVFYLNDTKLDSSWQVVQHMTHRNTYDIPTGIEKVHEENEEDNSDEVYQKSECIGVNATVQQENNEDSNLLHRDDVPAIDLGDLIPVDDVYVQLDGSMFINDLSNEEWDTESNHEEETYSDDDVSSSDQEKDLSSNDESIGDLRNED